MSSLVEIDGSVLEGGGQILRISLALSSILGVPISVNSIRLKRRKPGLSPQHLTGLKLVSQMTSAQVSGACMNSTHIEFIPGKLFGGFFTADVLTAGSISLLLQVALPCAIFCETPVTMKLKGGTNAEMAPQIDFITEVARPNFEKFGLTFDFDLLRRGYFPKGGGEADIKVKPVESLKAVVLDQPGKVTSVYGWSFTAGSLPISMAHGMANAAKKELSNFFRGEVGVQIQRYKEAPDMAIGSCAGIIIVAETDTGCILGGSSLSKRNVSPDQTGIMAACELTQSIKEGACVDQYTQDQVIIYMALAAGRSRIRVGKVTLHTETAIFVVELLTKVKFKIEHFGSYSIIECDGIGWRRPKST